MPAVPVLPEWLTRHYLIIGALVMGSVMSLYLQSSILSDYTRHILDKFSQTCFQIALVGWFSTQS